MDLCSFFFTEISDYAQLLGIDAVKESHLCYLAKEGLMQALPPDWKIWCVYHKISNLCIQKH